MSRYDAESLYGLLPSIYRVRDAEIGYPLRDLVTVLAGQAEVIEQDILRLYDNLFVETAEAWVVDYIGDLIGVAPLEETGDPPRAEVANTIGYRRRKGTAAVLEEIARAVTGWPARVQEYFLLLSTTQYMNHVRQGKGGIVEIRDADSLVHIDGPFDTAAHTADVRRIASRRGRHNIRNVGLSVWPIKPLQFRLVQPRVLPDTQDRYTFDVLGRDIPLFHLPVSETGIESIAQEEHVAAPIRRRALRAEPATYFGNSIALLRPGASEWERFGEDKLTACDLSDWERPLPSGTIAVDPVLGRLKFEDPDDRPEGFRVHYHHGFCAESGGGQYDRIHLRGAAAPFVRVGDEDDPKVRAAYIDIPGVVPNVRDTIERALKDVTDGWPDDQVRIVEIVDSRTYSETFSLVSVPEGSRLIVRAADGHRPTLRSEAALVVTGGDRSGLELDGLLIAAGEVQLKGALDAVSLRHVTLVPADTDLLVESGTAEIVIDHAILGRVLTAPTATVTIEDSIVDGGAIDAIACGGTTGDDYGAALNLNRVTVIGTIAATELVAENSILFGLATAERRQQGCVRYSWVEPGSRVPRRYSCQPDIPDGASAVEAARLRNRLAPRFVSLRFGEPAYGLLARTNDDAIRRGDENRSEMGAFSELRLPQREANLITRLEEYLPVGLEAGVFHQVFQRRES